MEHIVDMFANRGTRHGEMVPSKQSVACLIEA